MIIGLAFQKSVKHKKFTPMASCNPPYDHKISRKKALEYGLAFVRRERRKGFRRLFNIGQPLENMIIIDAEALYEVVQYARDQKNGYVGCIFGLKFPKSRNLTGIFFPAILEGTGGDNQCGFKNYKLGDPNLIRQTWIDPVNLGPLNYSDIVKHFFNQKP